MQITGGHELILPAGYAERGYPHDTWSRLRRESPVHRCEPPGYRPFWAITRHADICDIGKRPDAFLNAPGIVVLDDEQTRMQQEQPVFAGMKTIIRSRSGSSAARIATSASASASTSASARTSRGDRRPRYSRRSRGGWSTSSSRASPCAPRRASSRVSSTCRSATASRAGLEFQVGRGGSAGAYAASARAIRGAVAHARSRVSIRSLRTSSSR